MECPKCNNEVSESAKVCPHCNKVLLLECPVCHKLNRTALCEECGFVIISKCHKCGQPNKTINGKCKKCGFSTYESISRNEAEAEEFACLVINFPNIEDLRPALKNKQIFNKFYKQLKSYIFNYAKSQDNRAQLIDGSLIIKFYKEFSFSSSANKTIKSAIELMNKIGEISYKLKKSKGIKMACKMVILKRTLENDNEPFNTGLNVKVINTEQKKEDYADGLQIITDQYINTILSRQYKLELLYSSQVNDELIEFYEFPLKEHLIPVIEQDELEQNQNILTKPKELPKIADLTDEKVEIDLYSDKVIDIKSECEFLKVSGVEVPEKIKSLLKENCFISVRASKTLAMSSEVIYNTIASVNPKILHVVCSEGFVYEPYAFFKELIASYLQIDTKLANLDTASRGKIKSFDKDDYIYNLLIHQPLVNVEPQDALIQYMEIFNKFLELQKGSVIYIENIDLIDETSVEILMSLMYDFANYGISFVVTTNDEYIIHKEMPELLYMKQYKEITVTKADNEALTSTIKEDPSEILDSFYYQKILDQSLGGTLYFETAMQYLKDVGIFAENDGKLRLNADRTVIFPAALDQLMTKRFESLEENECFILTYSAYLGNNLIIGLLNDLGIDKLDEAIRSLREKKLINCNNFIIEVQNYRIMQKCIKEFLSDDVKALIFKNICEKLNTKTINTIKAMGLINQSNMTVYNLSNYALAHGDFNAYLRNCKKFISILDSLPKNEITQELKEAKANVYNTLSLFLNKYPSHKIYAISRILFEACMRQRNDKKIIDTSSLMLDSALLGKNYILAQQSLHQILIRLLKPEVAQMEQNVLAKNFFYSCINVKILFNAGKFGQCIDMLNKILMSINQDLFIQLGNSNVSKDSFVNYIMDILTYGALARVFIYDETLEQYFENIKHMFSKDVPSRNAITQLNRFIHHEEFDENITEQDNISKIIANLIKAIKNNPEDYNSMAQGIYNAKLIAKDTDDAFWSYLCDLLIGYCYQKLNSIPKAEHIYADVLNNSQKLGVSFLSLLTNWCQTSLKYETQDYSAASKLIGDTLVSLSRSANDNRLLAIIAYILQVNVVIAEAVYEVDIEPILYKINYACEKYKMEYLKDMVVPYEEYVEKYKQKLEEEKLARAESAQNNEQNEVQEENAQQS